MAFTHGVRHARSQGIGQAHQPQPFKMHGIDRLRPGRVCRCGMQARLGDRQHALPLSGQDFDARQHHGRGLRIEPAQPRDGLRSALGGHHLAGNARFLPDVRHGQQASAQRVFMHKRPAAVAGKAGRVELFKSGVQRALHGVKGLHFTGQHGTTQHLQHGWRPGADTAVVHHVGLAVCHHRRHGHIVARQRAGLVDAQHRCRAEGFNHRGMAREHLITRDAPGAKRHEDRQDDGKFFRQDRHCQSNAHQQAGKPVAALQAIEEKHQPRKQQAKERKAAHQRADFVLQGAGLGLDVLQRQADLAQPRGRSSGQHPRQSATLHDHRTGKDLGRRIGRTGVGRQRLPLLLAHRQGLAGEQGFIDHQVVALQHQTIGSDAVTLLEHEQVTTHHLASGNAQTGPITDHQGARTGQIAQGFEQAFGLVLLKHRDAHRDEHKGKQHGRVAAIAEHQVNGPGNEQQREHGLAHHFPGDVPSGATALVA